MHIGLDGIPLASTKTGIGHYTLELSQALARIDPADEFELISPAPFTSSLDENCPSNLKLVEAAKRRSWWLLGLPLTIRRRRLALFHGTNYDVPFWNECPTVLSIHDLSLLLYPETHLTSAVRRARYRLPMMARVASRIITGTECVKQEVVEHLKIQPERIAVTPYAPRNIFRPLPPDRSAQARLRLGVEDDFILFVGTMEPRKNLMTLWLAFAEVMRKTDLRPQLVMAGKKGWLIGDKPIENAAVNERVKFLGYVSDEDLRALYSSCLVCVYPSLYEGFGLPPLEAMACGAPVIASDISSLRETTGSAAVLVPPRDEQQLAEKIIEFVRDPDKRAYFSEAGLKQASRFTWERTAELTLQVYRDVLTRKPVSQKSATAQRP